MRVRRGGGINNRTSNSEVDDDIVGDRAGILVGASNTLGFFVEHLLSMLILLTPLVIS